MVSIHELESKFSDLPMLPGVIVELCRSDPNDPNFFEDLYKLARKDPTLASLIVSTANSAASSPSHHISDIRSALTRIGSQSVYKVVALASVSKVFIPSKPAHRALWLHSLQVGSLTSSIHHHLYGKTEETEIAFLCGLLHDIGRLVMFQLTPELIELIDSKEWNTPDDLVDIETDNFGFDHSKLGYLATKKIHMPSMVCNIIRYHHSISALTHEKVPTPMKRILLALQVADAISVYITRHPDWRELSKEQLAADLQENCLKPQWSDVFSKLEDICEELDAQMALAEEQTHSIGL